MHKWFAAFLIAALVWTWTPGRAQDAPQISSLKVSLWPEYDRPDMLVIYIFNLSSTTSLPANLTVRIPASSGEPHAVAVGPSETQVGDVPFTRRVVGEWAEVTFLATMPTVQFEYYDPSLEVDGIQRSFVYHWPGDYAVESMVVEVQQPLQASGMRISPSLGAGEVRSDGMSYFTAEVGRLSPGQTFNISLEYEKESTSLSAERLQVQPSQPLTPETPGRLQTGSLVPLLLGGLGIALIVGGAVWYWQSGQRQAGHRTAARTPRRRRRSAPDTPAVPPGEGIYCQQCGKRSGPSDRFCRSCGTRLRTE